ncbi:MAG: hypothetical protein D6689_01220 [Deltaproteobacteria bacterium]|nr:MAG: hypothetical protein D6689_01220 [Deltaproteobacteria bacterium]
MDRAVIRATACAVCAAVAVAGVPARADERARIEARLDRGKALFDELEYRKAIRMVAPVPHDPAATRDQRLRALELIGLAYLILGDRQRAREAFEDLLAIDPGYQLRDDTGSPKIRAFFDAVKRAYVPGFDPRAAAELSHAAPRSATAARPLEIEVRVARGGGRVKEMVVMWRRRGELDYDDVAARRIKGDLWRARIPLPPSPLGYRIDYYIEARDLAGGAIGRVGGPETPLSLTVDPGEPPRRTPWYRRWYVVAGGAVLVGIGAALVLTSGESAPRGTLEPGVLEL